MKYLFIFALALSFTNCTVEKRLYNKGYHVEWKHNSFKTKEMRQSEETNDSEVRIENTIVPTKEDAISTSEELEIVSAASKPVEQMAEEKIDTKEISPKEYVNTAKTLASQSDKISQFLKKKNRDGKRSTSSKKSSSKYARGAGVGSGITNFLGFLLGYILGPTFVVMDVLTVLFTEELHFYEKFDYDRKYGSSFYGSFACGAYAGIMTVAFSVYPAMIYVPLAMEYGAVLALTYVGWLALGMIALMLFLALLFWLLFRNVDWTFPNFGWGH